MVGACGKAAAPSVLVVQIPRQFRKGARLLLVCDFIGFRLVQVEVRADFLEKIAYRGEVVGKSRLFGLICGLHEVFQRFEPTVALGLDLGQFPASLRLLVQEFGLAPGVVLPRDGAVKEHVKQAVDSCVEFGELVLVPLRFRRGAVGLVPPPHLKLCKHQVGPLVGNGNPPNLVPHEVSKGFFPNIAAQVARAEFLGASVVVVSLLPFGGD
ncbi:MAG: hypothetical protein WBH98_05210 [Bacteroidales bacterium]